MNLSILNLSHLLAHTLLQTRRQDLQVFTGTS